MKTGGLDEMFAREHEQVILLNDRDTGLRAVIAIHDTRRGPALGGTRLRAYPTLDEAVLDALRLSEAMTYKAAVVGLPLGGGKAVILADGKEQDADIRTARLQSYAHVINGLAGRFITAEDVNIHPQDVDELSRITRFVVGTPLERGGSGDPAPATALGVLQGISALTEDVLQSRALHGVRVAIQGLGKVGFRLAQLLVHEGAEVIGTDLRKDLMKRARADLGIDVVPSSAIYDMPCDVFAPCAYGGVINDRTLPRLSCKIVAGSANNQLADEHHGEQLHERGIVYAVDYVINAGGLINAAEELALGGYDQQRAYDKVAGIRQTIKRMVQIAQDEHISTVAAAARMAQAQMRLDNKEKVPAC
jgi:leucine dehydrogenase